MTTITLPRATVEQALEALESVYGDSCDALHALRAALAEPVQEPVAWLTPKTVDSYMRPDLGYETCSKTDYAAFPVYTAPPQRKPLRDEEIAVLEAKYAPPVHPYFADTDDWVDFARAVERAHGIGEGA